jgi:hypothetical protein
MARFVVGGDLQHVGSLLSVVVTKASLRWPYSQRVVVLPPRFRGSSRLIDLQPLSHYHSRLTLDGHQGFQLMIHQLTVSVC